MNRAHSSFNKSDSEQQLNFSRIVVKSPQNSSFKINSRPHSVLDKPFTKISFINNNTPTKVFYSAKSGNKNANIHPLIAKQDTFEECAEINNLIAK